MRKYGLGMDFFQPKFQKPQEDELDITEESLVSQKSPALRQCNNA